MELKDKNPAPKILQVLKTLQCLLFSKDVSLSENFLILSTQSSASSLGPKCAGRGSLLSDHTAGPAAGKFPPLSQVGPSSDCSPTAALMTKRLEWNLQIVTCVRNAGPSFLHRKLHGLQTATPLLDIPSITNKSGIIRLELGICTISLCGQQTLYSMIFISIMQERTAY